MKQTLSLAVVLSVIVPAAAQAPVEKDHAERMARGTDIFKKHVRTVLVNECLKCHGGDKTEGEFDLTDRDRLLKGGDGVEFGDPKP